MASYDHQRGWGRSGRLICPTGVTLNAFSFFGHGNVFFSAFCVIKEHGSVFFVLAHLSHEESTLAGSYQV